MLSTKREESLDIPNDFFAAKDEGGAGDEGGENLLHRSIESKRRKLEDAVGGAELKGVMRGKNVVAQRPMRDHDALRAAGGAGGVNQIGDIFGMDGRCGRRDGP